MSEVASTPSTPGSASAARSRSSRSVRLFIAVGREPTASAPRAGWSAATIISRPLPRIVGPGGAGLPRARDGTGIGGAQVGDRGVVLAQTRRQTLTASTAVCSASSATSAAVGIAVEHSSRDATIAPAALA